MSDISGEFKLNLKTGFFKTEAYILSIEQESLKLIPANKDINEQEVIINYSNIKIVSISYGLSVEIEIRTEKSVFIGTFAKSADLSEIIKNLKNVLGKNFHIFKA